MQLAGGTREGPGNKSPARTPVTGLLHILIPITRYRRSPLYYSTFDGKGNWLSRVQPSMPSLHNKQPQITMLQNTKNLYLMALYKRSDVDL